jgi:hypothetical protein
VGSVVVGFVEQSAPSCLPVVQRALPGGIAVEESFDSVRDHGVIAAVPNEVGVGLTLDEFGMWDANCQ